MQNEELRRVFNISEHQHLRHNGFIQLPLTDNEEISPQTKKQPLQQRSQLGSKRKSVSADVVTAPTAEVAKRRAKHEQPLINVANAKHAAATSAVIANGTTSSVIANNVPKLPKNLNLEHVKKFKANFRIESNVVRATDSAQLCKNVTPSSNLSHYDSESLDQVVNRMRLLSNINSNKRTESLLNRSTTTSASVRPMELSNSAEMTKKYLKMRQRVISDRSKKIESNPENTMFANRVNNVPTARKSNKISDDQAVRRTDESSPYSCVGTTLVSPTVAPLLSSPLPNVSSFDKFSSPSLALSPSVPLSSKIYDRRELLDTIDQKTSNVTSAASSNSATIKPYEAAKLYLRAKRRKQCRNKWQMDSGTRHEALQRIRHCIDTEHNLCDDLFPLDVGETGLDQLQQSSMDSGEEYADTFQKNWFHSMSEIEFDDVKRNIRLGQLYNELRRQLYQIKRNKCRLPTITKDFIQPFVEITREKPAHVARCILDFEDEPTTVLEPLLLLKKKCSVVVCKNVALPCMPTCVRHILLCDKQTLFEQCRVRDSNSVQCDRPVFNIKYHYPICSVHSKPDFVLPDFSRDPIVYEDVRDKNTTITGSNLFKPSGVKRSQTTSTSTKSVQHLSSPSNWPKSEMHPPPPLHPTPSTSRRRNNANSNSRNNPNGRIKATGTKEKKTNDRKDNSKSNKNDQAKPAATVGRPRGSSSKKTSVAATKTPTPVSAEAAASSDVSSSNPATVANRNTMLRDWTNMSDSGGPLIEKNLEENALQNDFVNDFDVSSINSSSIQSQIEDMINSEPSLSGVISMGNHELPNHIRVEEMIEEVEITDETLDSNELNNQELLRSEDLNAVLKQLPPEAFNELFSDKSDSALEKAIEEMDVRKCALIDPSLLLEDIEPSSYSSYESNSASNTNAVVSKESDANCNQSQS